MNPKVNSAKRPEDFEVASAKAPDSFAPITLQTDKVLESISAAPSAKRSVDVEAAPVGDITIETLPAAYQQAFVKPEPVELTETRPVFTYKAPEGYRSRVQLNEEKVVEKNDYVEQLEKELKTLKNISYESIDRLMKSICREYAISPRKLHDEFKAKHKEIPDEWVKKNSTVESVKKQYQEEVARAGVQLIADNLPILPHHNTEVGMVSEEMSRRMLFLEKQMVDLKRVTIEQNSSTIVHGLGHESTGSGEVNLNRMDDVDVRGIQDGATLIWDEELKKWIPSAGMGVTVPGGNQEIMDKLNSLEQVIFSLQEFVASHTHTGDGGTIDDGHAHGATSTRVLTYESTTSQDGARTVDFDSDDTAFIIAEESVDLDHFHNLVGDAFLIEVEGGTTFRVDDHADHEPSWVAMEAYSEYNVAAREVNWDASDGVLLLALEETSFYHADFSDNILVELEGGSATSTSSTAQVFGFEVSTDTSSAASFDWDDDVNLLSPEGVVNPGDLSTAGDGTFVGLEEGVESQPVVNLNTNTSVTPGEFFDNTPGGDISRFRVTKNPARRVYRLDGIDQPAIQVPRGDIIEFELTAIEDREDFVIYVDGEELSTGVTRYPTLLSLNTSKLARNITKAYYRHRTVRGMGWIIVITDN